MGSLDWLPLCGTVLALGMRHGLDADHLAAIDGLTRYNSRVGSRVARWCGSLFSIGHGGVVMLVAGTIGAAAISYSVPDWARAWGAWISIVFLVGIGLLNLRTVLSTPVDKMVPLAGARSVLLAGLTRTSRPLGIIAIGALFAVSFDTLSQAVFFSAIATRFGVASSGIALGALFMLGMMLVDGINGAWVARLLRCQDRRARLASRGIGLLVAILSFGVAVLGVVRYFSHDADMALDNREGIVGVALVLAVAVGIALITTFARREYSSRARSP
jgi:high-affinity nickel-transport protein